jgi:hypothetical protein
MEHLLNRSLMAVLLTAGLMACSGDKGTDTDTDETDTDTDTEVCASGITSTFPDADAAGVFYRTPIEIVFNSDEKTTSTLTLADGAGADVAGTVSYNDGGDVAWFAPDADLAASTQYTLTASYSCEKVANITFTTSDAGTPVDGATLVDSVFNMDIAGGRITEPPGVGAILMPLIEDAEVYILVSATEYDATAMTHSFLGALGIDDGTGNIIQDVCTESIDFPLPSDYSDNPFMQIAGENVPIAVQGIELVLGSIELSGAFSPTGDAIEGLALRGFMDTSVLGGLLDLDPDDPQAACDLVGALGISCVDCGDGNITCLELAVDSMTADKQVGTLVALDAVAVAANDCAE